MSLKDRISLNPEEKRVDQEILNVIRRSEAGFVGTTEISDSDTVPRSEDTVRERLRTLEEDEKVASKKIGHPERGNLAWYIPEGQRQRPVNPDIYWVARVCEEGRVIGSWVLKTSLWITIGAFMLLLMGLYANVVGYQSNIVNAATAGHYGLLLAGAGFADMLFGGVLMWGFVVLEAVIERRATTDDRGQ